MSSRTINPVPVYEVMTFLNERSTIGRVVINPPEKMATLETHRTGENWYFCYVCGRSTLDQNKHLKHIKEHDGIPNKFTYPYQQETTDSPLLPRRKRTSNPTVPKDNDSDSDDDQPLINLFVKKYSKSETEKQIKCRLCDEVFSRFSLMRAHKAKMHLDETKFIQCNYCDQFLSKYQMSYHLKVNHNPEDEHVCPHCNCRKPTALGVHQHIAWKHPDKFIPFRNMPRTSTEKANINSTKSGPSDSKISKMSFKLKESTPEIEVIDLVEDSTPTEDLPTDEVLYRCKVCLKTFLTLKSLRKHFAVHGVKKHSCHLCLATFHMPQSMKRHLEVAHSNGLHECPLCPCRFELYNGLQTHIRFRHADEGL